MVTGVNFNDEGNYEVDLRGKVQQDKGREGERGEDGRRIVERRGKWRE